MGALAIHCLELGLARLGGVLRGPVNRRSALRAGGEGREGSWDGSWGRWGLGHVASHREEGTGERGPRGERGQGGRGEVVEIPSRVSGGSGRARRGVGPPARPRPRPQPARLLSRLRVRRGGRGLRRLRLLRGRLAHSCFALIAPGAPRVYFQVCFPAGAGAGGPRACSRASTATRPAAPRARCRRPRSGLGHSPGRKSSALRPRVWGGLSRI